MGLSRKSVEVLTDLVEIKLGYLDVVDREDAREKATLERCRNELLTLNATHTAKVVPLSPSLSTSLSRPAAPSHGEGSQTPGHSLLMAARGDRQSR